MQALIVSGLVMSGEFEHIHLFSFPVNIEVFLKLI